MLLHWTLILFIIGFLACIYAVATILNYTAIPYQVGVVILVAIIIATTFCYGFFQIYRINKDPRKNESYKLKNADFNIRFEDGKTANIEHILKLHKNRKKLNPQEKIICYTF